MIRTALLSCVLFLAALAPRAEAQALNLEFLPPDVEPNDVCYNAGVAAGPDDLTTDGDREVLTDKDRIRFLRRDIRVYSQDDADRYFDFIKVLIARRTGLDAEFNSVDAAFAEVDLWLRAGRMETLHSSGLIEGLRDRVEELSNNQRVTLARFYNDGIGVDADPAFAQELIREAAFGGNARALLEIARLAQQGILIDDWDAPLDLTVTMAFGGILGALDSGVCRRAEQIAQAYLKGDVVAKNPALALAWYRFAADLGRAESAWRVVEFHLNADAAQKDNIELRSYLEQAVRLGISISPGDEAALVASGAVDRAELQAMLGFNYSQDVRRTARSLPEKLELVVNIDGMEAGEDSKYLQYLSEISQVSEAPGRVFERLATETLIRRGRWAGKPRPWNCLRKRCVGGWAGRTKAGPDAG
ncbi:tetratricopeptide repeat protein [Sulfitobacter aestuariivivens]|uniref:tetratricopeptide repeat protein n=1 Tax=Sulfitobacter aestuariivivens TaxID=2766981 RepID=UPI00360E4636